MLLCPSPLLHPHPRSYLHAHTPTRSTTRIHCQHAHATHTQAQAETRIHARLCLVTSTLQIPLKLSVFWHSLEESVALQLFTKDFLLKVFCKLRSKFRFRVGKLYFITLYCVLWLSWAGCCVFNWQLVTCLINYVGRQVRYFLINRTRSLAYRRFPR